MRTPLLLAALAALAPAAPRAEHRLELGARVGYAAAFGDAARDLPAREFALAAQVPLELDVSLRLGPELAVGLYASHGVGRPGDAAMLGFCSIPGVSCSGSVRRAGVQGRWSFGGLGALVPWAGAALGWEWASVDARDASTGTSTLAADGPELALQGGGEYAVSPRLAVGPNLLVAMGRYRRHETRIAGATASASTGGGAFHGWIGVGVGGRFTL